MDEFPHAIIFQDLIEMDDGGGGKIKTWVNLFSSAAHVQPIKSSEFSSAQQLVNPIDHEIYYPYQKGVKGYMRVLHGTDILELRSSPLDQGGMGEIMMVKAQLK